MNRDEEGTPLYQLCYLIKYLNELVPSFGAFFSGRVDQTLCINFGSFVDIFGQINNRPFDLFLMTP